MWSNERKTSCEGSGKSNHRQGKSHDPQRPIPRRRHRPVCRPVRAVLAGGHRLVRVGRAVTLAPITRRFAAGYAGILAVVLAMGVASVVVEMR